MRWEDERYVRLYTRDTVDWEMLPWQSRALFPLLLRKVDRAGILQLGKHGAKGLALAVGMPVDVTETGLAGLLEDGSVELHGDSLVIRNFIEAQETPSSDAQRKRDSRERHRTSVTKRDVESQNVTESHDGSHGVTSGHSVPICAVPSRTVPSHSEETLPAPSAPVFDLDAIYAEYPRKVGKAGGIKALKRQIKTAADFDKAMQGVIAFSIAMKSEGRPVAKIPYFSSWANQEQWRDYADLPASQLTLGGAAGKTHFREPAPHAAETRDLTDEL